MPLLPREATAEAIELRRNYSSICTNEKAGAQIHPGLTTETHLFRVQIQIGHEHLFHAMPRMLTLWLDATVRETALGASKSKGGGFSELNQMFNQLMDNVHDSPEGSEFCKGRGGTSYRGPPEKRDP